MKPDYLHYITTDDFSKHDERVKWYTENIFSLYDSLETKCVLENNKIIVYGDLLIPDIYEEIPYKVDEVYGDVVLVNSSEHKLGKLKSLKNFPTIIHGKFDCRMNPNLKTLEGGPEYVGGSYWCSSCSLTNLNGIAKYIGGSLLAFGNQLANLNALKDVVIKQDITLTENQNMLNDSYYKTLRKENKISD